MNLTLSEVEQKMVIKHLQGELEVLWESKREEFKYTHTKKLYREHMNKKKERIYEPEVKD